MREPRDCFHLAIPVNDLEETEHFYVAQLGCKLARRYPDRLTLDFFGDQVVCHLSPVPPGSEEPGPRRLYPRHFGITFRQSEDFERLYELCQLRKVAFFADVSVRFEGLAEEHRTFVLEDPSGNLLEFKHYVDPRMMY